MPLWVVMLEKDRYNDEIILKNTETIISCTFPLFVSFPEVIIARAKFLKKSPK